ncbi:MAG TPA: BlaI/MecI/CopY family transcriptional regulator [Terriglobia bacterium]|nr:BlaI/MecI/CopY family transcriptional regulator [Terriglobia bacterium]
MKTQESLQVPSRSLWLTPLELDIMKAVWRLTPATVKDVQDAIHPWRPLAYTTVMTIMGRLQAKGFLRRSLRSRTYYYAPTVDFIDVRDAAVARIVSQFFDGSRENLLRFLDSASFSGDVAFAIDPEEPPSPALDETLL